MTKKFWLPFGTGCAKQMLKAVADGWHDYGDQNVQLWKGQKTPCFILNCAQNMTRK